MRQCISHLTALAGCWLKNRVGTSAGHPMQALMTFRGNGCFTCVSMMGKTGCPTSVGGEDNATICAKAGHLTVVASDAPLYLAPVNGSSKMN